MYTHTYTHTQKTWVYWVYQQIISLYYMYMSSINPKSKYCHLALQTCLGKHISWAAGSSEHTLKFSPAILTQLPEPQTRKPCTAVPWAVITWPVRQETAASHAGENALQRCRDGQHCGETVEISRLICTIIPLSTPPTIHTWSYSTNSVCIQLNSE